MVRVRLLTAFTALMLLAGTAAHATESEERALRDSLADRDEYRTKLLLELQRRETLLASQEETLRKQEARLKEMYDSLNKPLTEEEEDAESQAPQPVSVAPGGRKIKPDTPQARRAKDFESQTYKTNLARYNVAHTRKDIADIRALLSRHP